MTQPLDKEVTVFCAVFTKKKGAASLWTYCRAISEEGSGQATFHAATVAQELGITVETLSQYVKDADLFRSVTKDNGNWTVYLASKNKVLPKCKSDDEDDNSRGGTIGRALLKDVLPENWRQTVAEMEVLSGQNASCYKAGEDHPSKKVTGKSLREGVWNLFDSIKADEDLIELYSLIDEAGFSSDSRGGQEGIVLSKREVFFDKDHIRVGATQKSVAKRLGKCRQTICSWLKDSLKVRQFIEVASSWNELKELIAHELEPKSWLYKQGKDGKIYKAYTNLYYPQHQLRRCLHLRRRMTNNPQAAM